MFQLHFLNLDIQLIEEIKVKEIKTAYIRGISNLNCM